MRTGGGGTRPGPGLARSCTDAKNGGRTEKMVVRLNASASTRARKGLTIKSTRIRPAVLISELNGRRPLIRSHGPIPRPLAQGLDVLATRNRQWVRGPDLSP